MTNGDLEHFILGQWESGKRESEWGSFTVNITFNKTHEFKVESYFSKADKPIIVEGKYKVVDANLITTSWNAGKPIGMTVKDNMLVLKIIGEEPMILHRL